LGAEKQMKIVAKNLTEQLPPKLALKDQYLDQVEAVEAVEAVEDKKNDDLYFDKIFNVLQEWNDGSKSTKINSGKSILI
jgi:hypothetical protein